MARALWTLIGREHCAISVRRQAFRSSCCNEWRETYHPTYSCGSFLGRDLMDNRAFLCTTTQSAESHGPARPACSQGTQTSAKGNCLGGS